MRRHPDARSDRHRPAARKTIGRLTGAALLCLAAGHAAGPLAGPAAWPTADAAEQAAEKAAGSTAEAGTDHVLTIGGGYSPQSNQVSIEKNVRFFRRVLNDAPDADREHHLLFADGDAPAPDVQLTDPDAEPPRINRVLAMLLGPDDNATDALSYRYRSHEIEGVDGPSDARHVNGWFNKTGEQLGNPDRLLLYATGHGGRSKREQEQPFNSRLYLWGDDNLSARDLADRLEPIPPDVPVVLVMAQCYSGGFTSVIFDGADPQAGLAQHNRCGFFSTVRHRPASGCTPSIDEAGYQDYSTHFWAALHGRTRLGEKIEPPDYNNDGRTAFNEAHAYALIHADSIDIPVKTSGTFLREYSTTDPRQADRSARNIVQPTTHFRRLLALTEPAQRAVLENLSRQLELGGARRIEEARRLAERIGFDRNQVQKKRDDLRHRYDNLREKLATRIKTRWPELSHAWHPGTSPILEKDAERILQAVQRGEAFAQMKRLNRRIQQQQDEDLALERQWAKCRRLIRTAENVALAANLSKTASEAVQEHYEQLRAAEAATLSETQPETAAEGAARSP